MEKEKFINILNNFKLPIALFILGIVLILGGYVSSINSNKTSSSLNTFPKESLVNTNKNIAIDVSGAVVKPGVYQIKGDSRVEDAVLAAGGITSNANNEYISKYLNMAQKLSDGMKIYIPYDGESQIPPVGIGGVAGTVSQVNINSASQSELEALPGIGPVTAAKIIGSRPYKQIEDLLNQKIVSKATFEKIKSLIVTY